MAVIRPFLGLRFTEAAGEISCLVAPPYDVLSPAQRDDYAARSPHNIVHLTLPESKPDDRSKYVKYARSAALLTEWRREEILAPEGRPTLYRYTQSFRVGADETYTRTSVIALLKVEPYDRGVVLPHERTFPKHKEDRQRLLEATRTHLEQIFGLFEDPDGRVHSSLRVAPVGTAVHVTSDDGVSHVFEPIVDEATTTDLVNELADKKIWIADGHHRYETALAFREALGEREGDIPEDFLPIALCSMSDPGLVLLPTHRVVSRLGVSRTEALERFASAFDVTETHSSRLIDGLGRHGPGTFGVAFEGGLGYLLTPKEGVDLFADVPQEGSDRLRQLDVSVLHSLILERMLGVRGQEDITYTRDPLEAVRSADTGAGVAFLMSPPTVDDMQAIALGGERMPQKSTYYFPKILSGLVLWNLNDF